MNVTEVFDYIKNCTDEERKAIVEIFLEWFRETYHAASLNTQYMILERGEIRPNQVLRSIAGFSRDFWFHEFIERASAKIEETK